MTSASTRKTPSLFTQAEYETIIVAFVTGQGRATEDEIKTVVEWAEQARIDADLLDLVLKGLILPTLENGEIAFKSAGRAS